MVGSLRYCLDQEVMGLAEFIEVMIPCTNPNSFILTKNYTMVETLEHSFGKWPDQFGNGFFIEGEYLFEDFLDMFRDKIESQTKVSKNFEPILQTVDDYINLIKKSGDKTPKQRMYQYAMQVLGKLPLRDEIFIET